MAANRRIELRAAPEGALAEDHFTLREAPPPAPAAGQALIRTVLISIDAANRAWMQGATYRPAVKAGDTMPGYVIGEVVESRAPALAAGDIVAAEAEWADYAVVAAERAAKLPRGAGPLPRRLSTLGIAGKTAWHGLTHIGRPRAGETVAVSAAAGSVGAHVGQIARALDCRAVGIAGGAEKCDWATRELGFDACVDYRAGGLFKQLRAACPDGIDVYFDNVGGKTLETALFLMNMRGRVVCCGAVSQYDSAAPSGPRNLPGIVVVKRLRMEGFIVMDFADRDAEAERALAGWLETGAIRPVEDIVAGLENAPRALIGLLAGENRGKRMVRVAPDPA